MVSTQLQLLDPKVEVKEKISTQGCASLSGVPQINRDSAESSLTNPRQSLEATLQYIFPTQQEDSRVQKARRIMGEEVKDLDDEELEVYITKFQYLIDSWLDEYEKSVFNNLTLKQVLREV